MSALSTSHGQSARLASVWLAALALVLLRNIKAIVWRAHNSAWLAWQCNLDQHTHSHVHCLQGVRAKHSRALFHVSVYHTKPLNLLQLHKTSLLRLDSFVPSNTSCNPVLYSWKYYDCKKRETNKVTGAHIFKLAVLQREINWYVKNGQRSKKMMTRSRFSHV